MKVATFTIPAPGHAHPMLAVAAALARRGVTVRNFGPPELEAAVAAVGCEPVSVAARPPMLEVAGRGDLVDRSFVQPLGNMDETLAAVERFSPDLVLFDPFSVHGFVAARVFGLPTAELVTFPGYGALGDDFVRQWGDPGPAARRANAAYLARYGLDILGSGLLPVVFPAGGVSLVTTVERQTEPLHPTRTPLLFAALGAHVGPTEFVGACYSDQCAMPIPSFPFDRLDDAKRANARVVLFSLGTVITDFRFGTPVGGAPSGEAFLRAALQWLVDAFGEAPDVVVVVATGPRLDWDDAAWPHNFVARTFVPQRAVLDRYADVFITHHGASSTNEALLAGVPMVSLPGAGDQLASARLTCAAGAASARWSLSDPFATCDGAALADATYDVLHDDRYRRSSRELGAELRAAGGATRAADVVVDAARVPSMQGHGRH